MAKSKRSGFGSWILGSAKGLGTMLMVLVGMIGAGIICVGFAGGVIAIYNEANYDISGLEYGYIAYQKTIYMFTYLENTLFTGSTIANFNVSAVETLVSGNGLVLYGSPDDVIPTVPSSKKRSVDGVESVDEVEARQESYHIGGIKFVNNPNGSIAMDGGNITGAGWVEVDNISGNVRNLVQGVAGRAISVGEGVGFINDGTLAPGYATVPSDGTPLIEQAYYLVSNSPPDQNTFIQEVRFNETDYAIIYRNASSNGGIFAKRIRVNTTTNQQENLGHGQILAGGIAHVSRQFKACSFQRPDGTGMAHVFVAYIDTVFESVWGIQCDLSTVTAPVCQVGGTGNGTALVFSGLDPHINSLTCNAVPTQETSTSARYPVIAFTDGAGTPINTTESYAIATAESLPLQTTVEGGWVFSSRFLVPAATAAVFPIKITTLRQIGAVSNLTDVSTSQDLASCINCIYLSPASGAYYSLAWRSNPADPTSGQTEIESVVAAPSVQPDLTLVTRWAGYWINAYDNPSNDGYEAFAATGIPSGDWMNIYFGFSIGDSTAVIATAVRYNIVTLAYGTSLRTKVAIDAQAVTGSSAFISLAADGVCSNRLVVSYSASTPRGIHGKSVVVAYESTLLYSSVSSGAIYSNSAPYVASVVWNTYGASAFTCTGLIPFATMFVTTDEISETNTTVFLATGYVATQALTYSSPTEADTVVGVAVTSAAAAGDTFLYQAYGEINMCDYIDTTRGVSCPYELPAPVYVCNNGAPTFSPYCTVSSVASPAQRIGFTNVDGNVLLQIAPAAA